MIVAVMCRKKNDNGGITGINTVVVELLWRSGVINKEEVVQGKWKNKRCHGGHGYDRSGVCIEYMRHGDGSWKT